MGHRNQSWLGVFHFSRREELLCRSLAFTRCQQHLAILEVNQIECARNGVAYRAVVQ